MAVVCVLGGGCEPAGPPTLSTGTMQPSAHWPSAALRPTTTARGLSVRTGPVAVLEGDAALISGQGNDLGLRLDAERNDLAAIMSRYVDELGDAPGLLVLFTTFDDNGTGGPAYFVPVFNETEGTGMGPIDQRGAFGTRAFEGFINMKQPSGHDDLAQALAHEVAHRHLAYMAVAPVGAATAAPSLLGRQLSHWHAALDAEGSILEGYDWRESGEGRFVAVGYAERFSRLDLYGLGLLDKRSVGAFFFIEGATVEGGGSLPPAAQVPVGTVVFGTRVDLDIDDVIAALGERLPDRRRVLLSFAVLTRPGQAYDAPEVQEVLQEVTVLSESFSAYWSQMTQQLGEVCVAPCGAPLVDAGSADTDGGEPMTPDSEGCECRGAGATVGTPAGFLVLALLLATRTRVRGAQGAPKRRPRRPTREPSCGCSRRRGESPSPESRRRRR